MNEIETETGYCSRCGVPSNNQYCIFHGERWMVDADGSTKIICVPLVSYTQAEVDAAADKFKSSKQDAESAGFVELGQWDTKDLCFLILEKLSKIEAGDDIVAKVSAKLTEDAFTNSSRVE